MRTESRRVAVACQGGGSHAAFAAGILMRLFQKEYDDRYELIALSGTSGGAVCAALAWSALIRSGGARTEAARALAAFWDDLSAREPCDATMNWVGQYYARLPITMEISPYAYFPLAAPRLLQLLQKHVRLESLSGNRTPPALFVGATDITSGVGFALEGTELVYEDLLASAAVPPLFRAVRCRERLFWDGLFSRNPPIRELTNLSPKPDEIWVIQINPQCCPKEPTTMSAIIDRRNELSGNLALEQELVFVDKMNELLCKHESLKTNYRPIGLRRVELDLDLDYVSKLDRNPTLIDRLIHTGYEKAPQFFEANSLWTAAMARSLVDDAKRRAKPLERASPR
jgi:NTE family protein